MDFSTHCTLIPLAMPLLPPMFCFAVTLNAYGLVLCFSSTAKIGCKEATFVPIKISG